MPRGLRALFTSQNLTLVAGFILIAAGIICLFLSDKVVTGWWQGTPDAFGVGFIVAGIVDVLAISALNQRTKTEDRRLQNNNQRAEQILRSRARRRDIVYIRVFLDRAGGQIDPRLRQRLLNRITRITARRQPAEPPEAYRKYPRACRAPVRGVPRPRRLPAAATRRTSGP